MTSPAHSLESLLNSYLANDKIILQSTDLVCSTLVQCQLIRHMSHKPNDQNYQSILNRWYSRLNSLISSNNTSLSCAGIRLALESVQQNPIILLSEGSRWLTSCQILITQTHTKAPQCFSASVDLALYIFNYGSNWPDFARANCSSQNITALAKALLSLAEGENLKSEPCCVIFRAIATLIKRHRSCMRPLASQLQTFALSHLLATDQSISEGATSLLTRLYQLSYKAEVPSSWCKTVNATIGTIEIVLHALLSPILKEHQAYSDPTNVIQPLAPLDISLEDLIFCSKEHVDNPDSQLAEQRIPLLLYRSNRLNQALIRMLSQPTERSVTVPIGELSALACRMLLIGKAQPIEHPDHGWQAIWDCVGGPLMLKSMGCRLISQLADVTTCCLTPYSSHILSVLASDIELCSNSETARSDACILYAAYARVSSSCPPNPTLMKQTLEPVLQAVLQDIKRIYGAKSTASATQNDTKPGTSKKSKRFDSDCQWTQPVSVSTQDCALANRALNTLGILLSSVPYFFPSPYLTIVVRTLLGLACHPSFTSPISNTKALGTALSNLTNVSSGLTPNPAFCHRPGLRSQILKLLINCLPIQSLSSQPTMGVNLAQSLIGVLEKVVNSTDDSSKDLVSLARAGLRTIDLLIRPRVPPVHVTSTQADLEEESEVDNDKVNEVHGLPSKRAVRQISAPGLVGPSTIATLAANRASANPSADQTDEPRAKSVVSRVEGQGHVNILETTSLNSVPFPLGQSSVNALSAPTKKEEILPSLSGRMQDRKRKSEQEVSRTLPSTSKRQAVEVEDSDSGYSMPPFQLDDSDED